VVEPETSKAVSPSLFTFQSSDEGASYLYSQSSNKSVEVQRSSNAFSSQPTRLPAKSKALKWFQQLSESTPVFYLPFCHRTKALKGFVIKPIRSNIPPCTFYSNRSAKLPFGLSFGFPPCDVIPISIYEVSVVKRNHRLEFVIERIPAYQLRAFCF